jgi:RNA polymerase sigma-70 factor (ECF subfamily)
MHEYSSYSDSQLVALLKVSDEAAFTELYERYWKKLLVRANLLLRSNEDAEEVVHDIFVKLWKKRETITIINSFHTYIAAMLQYDCFKVLAEHKRKRLQKTRTDAPEIEDYSTQQFLDFEYLRSELEAAVSQLPERCQLIFRMSREQGLTDKQIAQELDVSVNTVRTQMNRALNSLKTNLNNFFLL